MGVARVVLDLQIQVNRLLICIDYSILKRIDDMELLIQQHHLLFQLLGLFGHLREIHVLIKYLVNHNLIEQVPHHLYKLIIHGLDIIELGGYISSD